MVVIVNPNVVLMGYCYLSGSAGATRIAIYKLRVA